MSEYISQFFKNYIEVCRNKSGILLDRVALSDLIINPNKIDEFISEFESIGEFERLADAIFSEESLGYPHSHVFHSQSWTKHLLHNFFINSKIYNRTICGIEFDTYELFNKFIEEIEKESELSIWGELIGLSVEVKENEEIEFIPDRFFENKGKLWADFKIKQKTQPGSGMTSMEDLPGLFSHPFSNTLHNINLYFSEPIFSCQLQEKDISLLSNNYNEKNFFSLPDLYNTLFNVIGNRQMKLVEERIEQGYNSDPEFFKVIGLDEMELKKLEAESSEYNDAEEAFEEVLDKALHYFIKTGKLGNYLPREEVDQFKKFIHLPSNSIDKNCRENLIVAVDFFKEAHLTPFSKLSLLKYTIALEALYLPNEGELNDKLSMRVANLIGRTEDEKKEIRENCLEVYKIRSKYVHGKTIKVSKKFMEKFGIVEKGESDWVKLDIWLRNIARKSILAFMALSKYYPSNKDREKLLDNLSNPFDDKVLKEIQQQASELLSMARS